MLGYLCNIGLVLACLPNEVQMSLHHLAKPSGIPILSQILLCTLVIPIFHLFKFERGREGGREGGRERERNL